MSLYSLHTHPTNTLVKDDGVSTMTAISVHQNGEWLPGSAFVHLITTPTGDSAFVRIRAESQLVNEPTRPADFTSSEGGRHYYFASHEAALAFLRNLYGITQAETVTRNTTSTRPAVPVSPRSVPAPLARDVDLSCPASQHGMTDRASFLAHTATYQQPLTARNTQ